MISIDFSLKKNQYIKINIFLHKNFKMISNDFKQKNNSCFTSL